MWDLIKGLFESPKKLDNIPLAEIINSTPPEDFETFEVSEISDEVLLVLDDFKANPEQWKITNEFNENSSYIGEYGRLIRGPIDKPSVSLTYIRMVLRGRGGPKYGYTFTWDIPPAGPVITKYESSHLAKMVVSIQKTEYDKFMAIKRQQQDDFKENLKLIFNDIHEKEQHGSEATK